MTKNIRVAILEDHLSSAYGYRWSLRQAAHIQVVGEIEYGEEVEPFLQKHPIDVLLADINVPTSADNPAPYPVLHLIPRLLQLYPQLEILVISMHTERALIQAVLDAGASGYVLKDDRAAIERLEAIIDSVAVGGIFLSDQAHQRIRRQTGSLDHTLLTPRQGEALSLCAAYPDMTTSDLARRMGVTNSTARNLLSGAYLRLNVSSRAAAIDKARRLGLITPPDPFPQAR